MRGACVYPDPRFSRPDALLRAMLALLCVLIACSMVAAARWLGPALPAASRRPAPPLALAAAAAACCGQRFMASNTKPYTPLQTSIEAVKRGSGRKFVERWPTALRRACLRLCGVLGGMQVGETRRGSVQWREARSLRESLHD